MYAVGKNHRVCELLTLCTVCSAGVVLSCRWLHQTRVMQVQETLLLLCSASAPHHLHVVNPQSPMQHMREAPGTPWRQQEKHQGHEDGLQLLLCLGMETCLCMEGWGLIMSVSGTCTGCACMVDGDRSLP